MRTILANATLIDCVTPEPRPDSTVVIDDGRISQIVTRGEPVAAAGANVIDLAGAYLLPGLWDVHVHPDYLSLNEVPLAEQVALFGHRLMSALTESGIVGFRCAGHAQLHGRRVEACVRFGPVRGAASLRLRPFPDDDRRALPDDGSRARMRRAVRFRESDPRADQERRRSHQVESLRRHHGSGVGPPLAFVPAPGRARSRVRDLQAARVQGDGARDQSRMR